MYENHIHRNSCNTKKVLWLVAGHVWESLHLPSNQKPFVAIKPIAKRLYLCELAIILSLIFRLGFNSHRWQSASITDSSKPLLPDTLETVKYAVQ